MHTINIYVTRKGEALATAAASNDVDPRTLAEAQDIIDRFLPDCEPGSYSLLEGASSIIDASQGYPQALRSAVQRLREIHKEYRRKSVDPAVFVEHQHSASDDGCVYVCGDIHGQYDALMQALDARGFDRQKDTLYCTGDLIDRGQASLECLSLVFEPWFRSCLGNHEDMAWQALEYGVGASNAWDNWQANGGSWIYLGDAHAVRIILKEVISRLPLTREILMDGKRVGICHAEPTHDWELVRRHPGTFKEKLIWGRIRFMRSDTQLVDGVDAVIVGHTIVERPLWLGNMHYIDTGSFTKEGFITVRKLIDVLDEQKGT